MYGDPRPDRRGKWICPQLWGRPFDFKSNRSQGGVGAWAIYLSPLRDVLYRIEGEGVLYQGAQIQCVAREQLRY